MLAAFLFLLAAPLVSSNLIIDVSGDYNHSYQVDWPSYNFNDEGYTGLLYWYSHISCEDVDIPTSPYKATSILLLKDSIECITDLINISISEGYHVILMYSNNAYGDFDEVLKTPGYPIAIIPINIGVDLYTKAANNSLNEVTVYEESSPAWIIEIEAVFIVCIGVCALILLVFICGNISSTARRRCCPRATDGIVDDDVRRRLLELSDSHGGTPLNASEVKKFPQREFTKSENHISCVICTEDFTNGVAITELECGHIFHPSCILEWLTKYRSSCPICRRKAKPSNYGSIV
jgi:E3 ubiquitin-protein ligase RNF13